MEHRLVTGGEQFLPFARSRIKALRAAGLTYASQQFEIDGCSIKVRIEPGHEYIRIEGLHRGFIEEMFLSGPNNPATAAELAAYLAAQVEAEKSPEKPKLLGYSVKDAKWFTRGSTDRGAPIGYSVVYTPERIPEHPVGDKDYFDVVYRSSKGVELSTPSGVRRVLTDTATTYGVPFLIPPKKDAQPDTLESEEQVFFVSQTGLEHVPKNPAITPTTSIKVEDILDTAGPSGEILPLVASAIGLPSFGVVNTANDLDCSAFGTRVTYGMDGKYLNVYYWCVTHALVRLPPYINFKERVVAARNYRRFVDVATGAVTTNESLDTPGETALASASVTVADIMEDTFTFVRSDEAYGYNWYIRTGRRPGGVIGSNRQTVTGTSNPITFKNTVLPYRDTYKSGCQTGVVDIVHNAEIAIDFSYESSFATASAFGPAPPESADYWPGLYFPDGITETPGVTTGSSVVYTKHNRSSTSVSYASGEHLLFSMKASVDYDATDSTTTSFGIAPTERISNSGGGAEFPVPLGETPSAKRYFSWSLSENVVVTPTETTDAQWRLDSSVKITIRDYLFHDIENDVAVCVESVASGERNSVLRGQYDGAGRWKISVVVHAKGVRSEFVLAEISNTGHNIQLEEHDFLMGAADQPTYIDALTNIAVYSPVCEQGAFPYIAYTTLAEDALGVPARFTLALPLSLINPNDVLGADPTPPEGSYTFAPYNLADASDLMMGSKPFSGVVGNCYQINVSHDGKRNWLADIGGIPPANCYRV